MKKLAVLFLKVLTEKFVALALLFFVLVTMFFAVQNGSDALSVFTLRLEPSFLESVKLFLSVLYDVENTFTIATFVLILLISFLQASLFVLFYTYMKMRNDAMHTEKIGVLVSTLVALFGTSCAACGGAVITLLSSLGVFGAGVTLNLLDSSVILSLVSAFLLFSLYKLLKKLENPFVC